MALTLDERRALMSGNLEQGIVRMALAGFLHQELRNVHRVNIPPEQIERCLVTFVQALDTQLRNAEALLDAGVRPRKWERGH